ncbi:hypothetical protein HS088_TW22G01439 [Tripterygium wilfordii]|uniref:DUF1639 family protein n=1 Tax=Tripterygium wilfordii TaxID=458696 RepID=A0A7J7C0V7_TRIWF|nr:uncharacterized protein LOC119990554 [Tripterygium wilfordii]KAF5727742.1 hypothetical protein HS088_TW22G01439 [Tripterygium wilfordii]
MVCSEARAGQRVPKAMAMGYERTRPLHNFTLPCLKWGNQKHLRCQKVEELHNQTVSAASSDRKRRSPPSNSSMDSLRALDVGRLNIPKPIGGDGKEDANGVVGEIGMIDLVNALSGSEQDSVGEGQNGASKLVNGQRKQEPSAAVAQVDEARPWNLRTRRSACKAPIIEDAVGSGNGLRIERKQNYESPLRSESAKSPRVGGTGEKEKERAKFSIQLTKKEIEHDFMALVGHRPVRRPKKRPRIVQKELDSLFPGVWLREVTADMYKVEENPESGKR